jgi:hypothetical protein
MSRYVSGLRSSRAGSDEGSSITSMEDGCDSAGEKVSLRVRDVKLRRNLKNRNDCANAAVRARRVALRHAASSPPLPKPPAVQYRLSRVQFKAGVRDLPGVPRELLILGHNCQYLLQF